MNFLEQTERQRIAEKWFGYSKDRVKDITTQVTRGSLEHGFVKYSNNFDQTLADFID